MSEDQLAIGPEEIRAIRRELGLSQTEASELLGGGPRAFAKYEAGTVTPSASLIKLLRLLHANPGMLASPRGQRSQALPASVSTRPFEVTGDHIAVFTERMFPSLLRRLLYAEAQANDLPCDGIHVTDNIAAPDGGEDGRIRWEGGPDRTRFLPSRLSQFQLKAGEITPGKARRDVLTKTKAVKDMIRPALESDGNYVMLCAHRYAKKAVEQRETAIRTALRGAGMTIRDDQVAFWDADQIATWVNHHPGVVVWVKENTQPGTIGPLRSWSHWAGRAEHEDSPWVEDERLPALCARLLEVVSEPRGIVRVIGLSGIGKSRLVVEALGDGDEKKSNLSDIVLYADQSEVDSAAINGVVQTWADMGARAIVVVDRCPPESHEALSHIISRSSSSLSLVTIDNEIPTGTLDKTTIKLEQAPDSVIETIITRVSRGSPSEDQRRLVRFSRGFPGIAIRITQAWTESRPVAHSTEEHLVDSFVLGRRPHERELLIKSAMLLAASGLVGIEHEADGQLDEIAARGRDLSAADLRAGISRLVDRGVAQRRGRFAVLQPRPIAMRLAERQWRDWGANEWDTVLAGNASANLKIAAAKQLALLNTTSISAKIVAHVCRPGGPFDGLEGIATAGHAEVLSFLAEIDAKVVADQIERCLNDAGDLSIIKDRARRHLVWALEKIAFRQDTFEEGARLLLRLAMAETEPEINNNATGQFKALFQMHAGSTAADGESRLRLLNEVAETNDSDQQSIVADALVVAAKTNYFMRMVGAESHGSRPAISEWRPATREEARDYIKESVTRLAQFGERTDKVGSEARAGLGGHFRSLISFGLIDVVEAVVHQIGKADGKWQEALEGLGHFLEYDVSETDHELIERVRGLITYLQPTDLESRVVFLVTEMPWDFPCGEKLAFEARDKRKVDAVRELARDIVEHPAILEETLPRISRGSQRMASVFGGAIAESLESPLEWLERFVLAVLGAPESERNFDLLSGFIVAMNKDHSSEVDDFKRRAAGSADLAPALLHIGWRLGITPSDVGLVVEAFEAGFLAPSALMLWTTGGVLSKVPPAAVAPLFEAMLDHDLEGYVVAIDLMSMYAHGSPAHLDGLRPQVRKVAENAAQSQLSWGGAMAAHHFENIMKWILGKGRGDEDARATAFALATAISKVDDRGSERMIEAIVPILLSGFPEIAWPLIGQAIVSDEVQEFRLRYLLRGFPSPEGDDNPPILSLPEDTLFAWCHAHPDQAPAFAAATLPVLATNNNDEHERLLHPLMLRLLDDFGDREDVRDAINANMNTFSWCGSLTNYYALYLEPMRALNDHPKGWVRQWAKSMFRQLERQIDQARREDEEEKAQQEV